jgi:hypothetical protein
MFKPTMIPLRASVDIVELFTTTDIKALSDAPSSSVRVIAIS